MENSEFTELIPGLPHELGIDCLTRVPFTAHRVAARVCHRWRELLESSDFYYHRKQNKYTHQVACLVQALKVPGKQNPGESPSYGITVFDPVSQIWDRLDPVPKFPNGLPLFCQLASCEGKLVVMGGWDPTSYEPVREVFVYDYTTSRWRIGKEMPSKRSFFAVGVDSGRVYVAGGHDENKNALKTGWVYDLVSDEWSELTQMSQERDECEGVVMVNNNTGEKEFWVVSGYRTDGQGIFDGSADVYNFESGQWRLEEEVWESGRGKCPRSCVGLGKDGKLVNWPGLDPAVQTAACGVMLDNRVLITGSEYQGAPHGFYMLEMKEGQKGKMEKITVPEEFSGFVQSGCCVEI
ncbi:hypothetical protein ACFE04_006075 [Oxalis oulophora]